MNSLRHRDPDAHRRILAASLSACLAFAIASGSAIAQSEQPGGPPSAAAMPTATGVSEETRARRAEIEADIARQEAQAAEWKAKTASFAERRASAPQTLEALQAEVVQLKARLQAPSIEADLPLSELDTRLLGRQQDLTLARKEVATLDAEVAGRAERRKLIPERLTAAKERLRVLETESDVKTGDVALVDPQRRLGQARRDAIASEIASFEEELRSYDARGQLLVVRRELAALQVAALEAEVEALRVALTTRRRSEAEVAAGEAQRVLEAAEGQPAEVLAVVRALAEENRALALQRTGPDGLLGRIEDTSIKLDRAEAMVAEVTSDFATLRRQIASANGAAGLLRNALARIPDAKMYRRFIRMREDRIDEVQFEQMRLQERRRPIDDVDGVIAKKLAGVGRRGLSADGRAEAEALLRSLLETQRRYLDALIGDTETYFEKLVDFHARQQELVNQSEALKRFIDERILWIPSGSALSPALAGDLREALDWLLEPRFWGQVPRALRSSLTSSPVTFAGASLLLLALPFGWPRARTEIKKWGAQASAPNAISITPTALALLLSLLMAFWGPSLVAFLGWRLAMSVNATLFVRCFAYSLLTVSLVWTTLQLPRQLLRPGGIAVAHLGWSEALSQTLRRELHWLSIVALPAIFAIAMFEARAEDAWRESIGRIAFLLLMLELLVFTHWILRSKKGSLRCIVAAHAAQEIPTWVWRIVHVSVLLGITALLASAARGYYWTSLELAESFYTMLVFLFCTIVLYQLGARWLLLANRRLALRRWERTQEESRQRDEPAPEPATLGLEEPEVALATVDEQNGRLLRNGALLAAALGVWLIWADLLPVAGALRSVEIWQKTSSVTVEIVNAAGERITSLESRVVPVTLSDLLLAFVIAAATLALARNLPGLLEISVFRQLRSSAGERYAYATIGKYTVTVLGLAFALKVVGVGWGSIQWLVAAVGIGLGFGLQEIFANFISGLIILFERPIRVGDTVTVGDISGTVTRIRIRATWITGFDRKELVVPNKEFITTRLINWSLSDAVLRVEVPVGIAYGSDTDKALRVLEEVALRNAHVLREPPPIALFRGFGDSALNLELRVFSPDVSHYLKIVHELHLEIDRAFRREKIEIAFPQRDLHVRSMPVPRSEAEDDSR